MELTSIFTALQTAHKAAPYPSLAERKRVLVSLKAAIQNEASHLIDAVNLDYGHRSTRESLFELFAAIDTIRFCLRKLKSWMKNRNRSVAWYLKPAKAYLFPQPLGVIGIMAPYNYPLALSLIPAIYALAAGNRVMIKLSEFSQHLAPALQTLIDLAQLKQYIQLTIGDIHTAESFAALPFGHLLLTGSVAAGKNVMKIASQNLTPVTLELGGKSPVILSQTMNKNHIQRIVMGKLWNAGQTCIAADYALIPTGWNELFLETVKTTLKKYYSDLIRDLDYSNIISKQHQERLLALVVEAESQGAKVFRFGDIEPHSKKLPFYVLFDVTPNMRIMQEEIFGPLLPVMNYNFFSEAIEHIASRPNPLAIYYFGADELEMQILKTHTVSGALILNDTLFHYAIHDLPFGGVGHSGMGSYHGIEGFNTFSQLKPIAMQKRFFLANLAYTPYAKRVLAKLSGIRLR